MAEKVADKSLKNKAVNIKGKNYVLVSDRVVYFNETYPNGSIESDYVLEGKTYHFKALVIPDTDKPARKFTGHSQATIGDGMVNKTAAMENAETSAIGRALAMMGIGVIESIASADEINKATGSAGSNNSAGAARATDKQIKTIYDTVQRLTGYETKEDMDKWLTDKVGGTPEKLGIKAAGAVITKLFAAENQRKAESLEKANEPLDEVHDVPEGEINLDDIPF